MKVKDTAFDKAEDIIDMYIQKIKNGYDYNRAIKELNSDEDVNTYFDKQQILDILDWELQYESDKKTKH